MSEGMPQGSVRDSHPFLSNQTHCKKTWTVSTRPAVDFSDFGLSDMLWIQFHGSLSNEVFPLIASSQSHAGQR